MRLIIKEVINYLKTPRNNNSELQHCIVGPRDGMSFQSVGAQDDEKAPHRPERSRFSLGSLSNHDDDRVDDERKKRESQCGSAT